MSTLSTLKNATSGKLLIENDLWAGIAFSNFILFGYSNSCHFVLYGLFSSITAHLRLENGGEITFNVSRTGTVIPDLVLTSML